jgi:hypothetical protein
MVRGAGRTKGSRYDRDTSSVVVSDDRDLVQVGRIADLYDRIIVERCRASRDRYR